jgi:hypothetical protein
VRSLFAWTAEYSDAVRAAQEAFDLSNS